MTFSWNEFLGFAQELVGKPCDFPPSEETMLRNASSRAYYAAFCTARDWLRDEALDPDLKGRIPLDSHGAIIGKYRDHSRNEFKKIGVDLIRMRTHRRRADYDAPLNIEKLRVEADKNTLDAKKVIVNVALLKPLDY